MYGHIAQINRIAPYNKLQRPSATASACLFIIDSFRVVPVLTTLETAMHGYELLSIRQVDATNEMKAIALQFIADIDQLHFLIGKRPIRTAWTAVTHPGPRTKTALSGQARR